MKKVKELKVGDRQEIKLLVSNKSDGVSKSGEPYLTLTLQDNSGNIEAKYWNVPTSIMEGTVTGKVYLFDLQVREYQGKLQGTIQGIADVEEEVDLEQYTISSPLSKSELKQTIDIALNNIENQKIASLVSAMLKYYGNAVYEHPAAAKIHHEFVGGLATHIAGMLKVAEQLCNLYPLLNRDYLYAGVILHDLGKIEELSSAIAPEYTIKGKLIGHISIMAGRLQEIGSQIGLEDSEELLLLKHLVLSHHGQLEYGSPVKPLTAEAEMLNYIDNIDARMNIISKAFADIKKGEFTPKLFALESRAFYKHQD